MFSFFLSISTYVLPVLVVAVFCVALLRYFFHFSFFETKTGKFFSFRNLAIIVIVGRIFNAALFTFLQFFIWKQNGALGEVLLRSHVSKDLPIDAAKTFSWLLDNKFGYFIFYSWGRFWISVAITLIVSFFFYWFLRVLKSRKERFFETGETELGFVCALLVGWPAFVLFVPFVFLSVVIISIIRLLFLKEQYTTLGAPFLLACALSLFFGGYLISVLGLSVLRV